MKKYSILVAAFAVLAFVGCKKDNNGSLVADQNGMITLEMSGETHQDNGKQSFYGTANRIFFDEGDQMIVNGSVCNVTPLAVTGDDLATEYRSYKAKVSILAEYAYTPLYAMYPADVFTLGTAADYSDMTVEMYNDVDLFTVADNNVILTGSSYQPWPMTAYLADLNTPRIQLKNNIALVTPSVKFGYPFVNQFVQDFNIPATVDANNLPTLNIEKVVISSSDQNLYGTNGYIDGLTTQEPKLVFPGTPTTPSAITCWVPADRGTGIIATGTSDADGVVKFKNASSEEMLVQSGRYFIKETKAPDGYNKYTDVIPVNINVTYSRTITNGTYIENAPENGVAVIEVKNSKTVLPQTGGVGNYVVYGIAGLLAAAGVTVFIISRKKKDQKN